MTRPSTRLWPFLAVISTATALISSGIAVYTTWHLEAVLQARSEEQLHQLTDRMNDAIAAANTRSVVGDAHLDKRIDAIKMKFDPLPGQVDAAVQDMRKQVAAVLASVKAAAPQVMPAPIAVHDDAPGVKRRKAG